MADIEHTKTKPRKTTAEVLANAQLKADAALARKAEKPHQEVSVHRKIFLPGLTDLMRAMPNHIARSSLFAPVAPGRKKTYVDKVLVSRADAIIKFWGQQLDESQADVWLQAMHEAIKQPLGVPIIINRLAFLKALHLSNTGPNYLWLHKTMKVLSFAMLIIEFTKNGKLKMEIGKTRALHLIEGFDYDENVGAYTLRIDPRWHEMYANREFSLIEWDKRMRIGPNQNMAKALQRLVATSNDSTQRYALDWLKEKLIYTSPLRKFKESLEGAMRELERLKIISDAKIEISTKGKLQAVWQLV